jgi:hypothetical protein
MIKSLTTKRKSAALKRRRERHHHPLSSSYCITRTTSTIPSATQLYNSIIDKSIIIGMPSSLAYHRHRCSRNNNNNSNSSDNSDNSDDNTIVLRNGGTKTKRAAASTASATRLTNCYLFTKKNQ